MPYIKQEFRNLVDRDHLASSAGELNYLITRLVMQYIKSKHGDVSYDAINEVVGVLECVKQEFYCRVATVYEEIKQIENGDVPEYAYFDKHVQPRE